MEANFTQELQTIKAKGWKNNYFPLRALRLKYAKLGLSVEFMWFTIEKGF
jgi:hypothetical protein